MAPFYGWGSTALRLQFHYEEIFTTKFREVSGTHYINLRWIKG